MMRKYGKYIMSGAKTIGKNYIVDNRVSFYLNEEQITLMNLTRDVFEQRDLIPDGMSTSVFVKTVVLDVIPKFLKTVSIEEMEKATESIAKLAEERKELKAKNRRKRRKKVKTKGEDAEGG